MKRQRGRNRGSGGNSGKPQHNTNRAFDSNGPDGVKVRGAAQHVYEKYQQLARDAHTSGDRVIAENYLQHAEHYFRVMRAMQPQRPVSEIIGRDQFVSGYDIDFEDESGLGEATEGEAGDMGVGDTAEGADRVENRRDDRQREDFRPREDYRPRDETRYSDSRPRDDRGQSDRYQGDRSGADRTASDRPQNDRPPQDRSGNDRSSRSYREDRPRYGRDDRNRGEARNDQVERPVTDPMSVVEPESTPLTAAPATASANMLRADDGDVSHAPAFLQLRPSDAREEAAAEPRRPRRRRTPSSAAGGEVTAGATASEEV
jgi:hypothetical protein